MASCKAQLRTAITAAVRKEFPPAEVQALREEGGLISALELWLELVEESFPTAWRRDFQAMGLKYALAALVGEGVQWEPKRVLLVFEGDPSLFVVKGAAPTRLTRNGGYASRRGRVFLRQEYSPSLAETTRQGEGGFAFVGGVLQAIAWPVHACELPAHMQPKPRVIWDEEVFGERYI